jgi:hypothetical protein
MSANNNPRNFANRPKEQVQEIQARVVKLAITAALHPFWDPDKQAG